MVYSTATKTARKLVANAKYRAAKRLEMEAAATLTRWSTMYLTCGSVHVCFSNDSRFLRVNGPYSLGGHTLYWDEEDHYVVRKGLSVKTFPQLTSLLKSFPNYTKKYLERLIKVDMQECCDVHPIDHHLVDVVESLPRLDDASAKVLLEKLGDAAHM